MTICKLLFVELKAKVCDSRVSGEIWLCHIFEVVIIERFKYLMVGYKYIKKAIKMRSRLEELRKKYTDKKLAELRRQEIDSYEKYFEAVLKALDLDVIQTLEGFCKKLRNGTWELSLYGKICPSADKDELRRYYPWLGAVNGDGSWASGVGEELLIVVEPNNERYYLHRLQEGKYEDLARYYDRRYESLDEPKNYNYIWLWRIEEYKPVKVDRSFFEERGYDYEHVRPQTLFERRLSPREVALHPIFAQSAKRKIETICNWKLSYRKQMADSARATIDENYKKVNRILAALGE